MNFFVACFILERSTPASVTRQPSDRRPDSNGMVGSDSVCGTNSASDIKISQAIDIDSHIQDTDNDHRSRYLLFFLKISAVR